MCGAPRIPELLFLRAFPVPRLPWAQVLRALCRLSGVFALAVVFSRRCSLHVFLHTFSDVHAHGCLCLTWAQNSLRPGTRLLGTSAHPSVAWPLLPSQQIAITATIPPAGPVLVEMTLQAQDVPWEPGWVSSSFGMLGCDLCSDSFRATSLSLSVSILS